MSFDQSLDPGQTTVAEANDRAREGGAVLLDVREEDEFAAGHAPGAVPLPLSVLKTGAGLPDGVEGRLVLAICRSGNRSQRAVGILAERGVEALNVSGGMKAWAEAGLPVTTPQGLNGQVI